MLNLRPTKGPPVVGTRRGPDAAAKTIVAWQGTELAGAAFVSQCCPPGPPLRGVYHVEALPAAPSGAEEVLAQCIAWVARQGGRRLWSYVPLAAVDAWRRGGFAVAGPPLRLRGGEVGTLMVRAVDDSQKRS